MMETATPHSLKEWILKFPFRKCILSSVTNEDEAISMFLQNEIPHFINLNHTTPLPYKNLYHTPESLGNDRIAGIAGAYNRFPGANVLVIDLGTAITYDLITSNGEYKGGNISPGLVTRFNALHSFTSRLPLLGKADVQIDLGTDTRSAIIAGVQNGILYEINGYIEHNSTEFPDLVIILTGGDADFFANKLKKPIFVDPNLILSGLNAILEYNIQTI